MRSMTLVGLLAVTLNSVGCATVTPGTSTVAVQVCGTMEDAQRYKVLKSGRYWANPCTEHFRIPLREQRAVWTKDPTEGSPNDESISFAAVDGQKVNIDIGIGYQIPDNSEDIIKMIRTYGPNLEETIDQRVRDQVRHNLNICSSTLELTVQDVYGTEKDELFQCAERRLQDEFNPNGLVITRLTLNSDVRLPTRIREAMEKAQAATQEADQARRELEKAQAEKERKLIEAQAEADATKVRAEGEAEANRTITRSLTPEVLQLRQLEIQRIQAESWDGKLPDTVMGGDIPFVMVK